MDNIIKDNLNIDVSSIEEYFKIIVDLISKPVRYFVKINEINNFTFSRELLYEKMDDLANVLKVNSMFYEEYFDIEEISDMIKDTLNRELSLITDKDLDFITEICNNFFEILHYKLSLIMNNEFGDDKYKLNYNSFLAKFDESKNYYFEHIFKEDMDKKLFTEYCKTIMG